MSDTSQGPGWWQASDGKWYPPEQAPGYQPPADAGGGGGGAAANFEIGAALSYGWNKFIQYIGQIVVIVLIIFGIEIVFNILSSVVRGSINSFFVGTLFGLAFTAAGWFLAFLLQAGLIRAGLAVTRGQAPEPGMLFQTERLGPYAVAAIIVSLLSLVGLFLCCIPGLLVLFFTYFFGFYVIDRGEGATDSIASSFNLVKDNLGSMFLLMLLVVVLNAITCGLASGVTFLALAYAYRTLNGETVAA
ncbi:MAG TPA: hypothetical protein VMT43_11325 [Acidimicrobiales bacterium]|nr:hypothetical protein [Acidimicrobiales bacterium]